MRISLHARSILRRWKLGSYFYLYYSRYAATLSQIQLQRTKPHFGVHVEVRLDINFSSPRKLKSHIQGSELKIFTLSII